MCGLRKEAQIGTQKECADASVEGNSNGLAGGGLHMSMPKEMCR